MENILKDGLRLFNISISNEEIQKFILYKQELIKWNKKINLTAISDEKEIIIKHFIDSLIPIQFIPSNSTLLDIGSGAGFPSIPLKLINNSLIITSIDSSLKKIDFQDHIIKTLNLKNIKAIHSRIEDFQEKHYFDIIISRAYSNLSKFINDSIPFLKKEGFILAMKGKNIDEELQTIQSNQNLIFEIQNLKLPFLNDKRSIIKISCK